MFPMFNIGRSYGNWDEDHIGYLYCYNLSMNKKDFSKWTQQKKDIHNDKERPFFHEREIWFAQLGENIGFEQDGRGKNFLRPLIVFKKFNKEVFLAIPLTTNQKTGKFYFNFTFIGEEVSTAILSQIRLVDAKRLVYKTGSISPDDFVVLKEKFKQLIA